MAALILGPFASKCIATSSYVSEDSKKIKHAVDNAKNFKQAKQRNRNRKQQPSEETLVSHRRFVTTSLKNTGL